MKKILLSLLAILLVSTAATAQTPNLRANRHVNGVAGLKNISTSKVFKNQKDNKVNPSKWLTSKDLVKLQSTAKFPQVMRSKAATRADESTTTWWTYPTGSIYGLKNSDMVETSTSNEYNLAVLVPSSLSGVKVDSVLFLLYDASMISNLKVWFKEASYNSNGYLQTPPTSASDYDYSFDVTNFEGGIRSTGYTMLELPKPYTVPSKGCIVGYSFTTTSSNPYPALFYYNASSSIGVDGGFLMCIDNVWYDMYQAGVPGNLTTALHIDTSDLAQNSVSPYGIFEGASKVGEEYEMTATVHNNSALAINSISFVPTQNGVAGEEQTYTFDGMLSGDSYGYVYFNMAPEKEGVNNVGFQITKVNGEANTAEGTTIDNGVLVGLTETAPRIPVVEEITGTWCGWCPRGHVGLANLKKEYGDSIVTLAAHIGGDDYPDAMATEDYYFVQYYTSGSMGSAPDAIFDRIVNGDPYSGLTDTDADGVSRFHADAVVEVIKQYFPSEAGVTLEAGWSDENHTALTARVNTTFKYNRDSYPYGLVFALTEDDMFGMGDGWTQTNYYSSAFAKSYESYYGQAFTHTYHDADMDEYNNAAYQISNQEYDNVIVGSWYNTEIEDGYYGAVFGIDTPFLTASNAKNQPISWTATLSFNDATKSLIQDDTMLSLAVLVVNNNNGQVVNAAQVKIGDEIFSGIKGVKASTDAVELGRYNVSGQRVSSLAKGLNIVKMSDGKVKKVVVK